MKSLSCPNGQCSLSGKSAVGHIIRYGFYTTKAGKRRRYQCQICGKTFCSTCGTPYYRLQHRRATFDDGSTATVRFGEITNAVSHAAVGTFQETRSLDEVGNAGGVGEQMVDPSPGYPFANPNPAW
jgi:hypothetical protein